MSGLRVNRAGPEDLDVVVALMAAQLDEHAIAPTRPLEPAIAGVLSDPGRGFLLLVRRGDAAIGAAYVSFQWSMEHGGHSAWLEELFVVPEERGRGAGRHLLDAAIAGAREAGCAALDLEVDADHARAENLYRRHGFGPLPRKRWVRILETVDGAPTDA